MIFPRINNSFQRDGTVGAGPANLFGKLNPRSVRTNGGFTLVELLVIVVVIATLAAMLVPARADSRTKSQSTTCLNNLKQIMAGTLMYTHDNHDMFPPNPDDGGTTPGYTWCTGQAGVGGRDEFNPDLMKDPSQNLLARYLGTNASVYRCTADTRRGLYDGTYLYPTSPLVGQRVPAARTISINQAVGVVDPGFAARGGHSGIPALPTNGPWLTGNYGQNNATTGPYRTYGRTSQVVVPTPAQLFVVTEEDPFSVNDGSFAMSVGTRVWIDFPGTLHNMACDIAFADGHTELHKWSDPKTRVTSGAVAGPVIPNGADWPWLSARTSARVQ